MITQTTTTATALRSRIASPFVVSAAASARHRSVWIGGTAAIASTDVFAPMHAAPLSGVTPDLRTGVNATVSPVAKQDRPPRGVPR